MITVMTSTYNLIILLASIFFFTFILKSNFILTFIILLLSSGVPSILFFWNITKKLKSGTKSLIKNTIKLIEEKDNFYELLEVAEKNLPQGKVKFDEFKKITNYFILRYLG